MAVSRDHGASLGQCGANITARCENGRRKCRADDGQDQRIFGRRSAGLVATKFFALQLGADGRLVGSRDYVAVDRADAEAKIKEWRSQ